MTLNFAILGAGRIGRVHAKAVYENRQASLVAVCDAIPDAADAVVRDFGGQVSSIDAVADDPDVNAVIICTPTDTHAPLIERFARSGKAIFCEKPIDLDIGRVKSCLSVVQDTNAALMVGFNRRFDPNFIALKQSIDEGHIGAVEQLTITSRDPGLPPAGYIKASGGIFRDMTIHDFDMARFLLNEEIASVFATASALVDPSLRDLGDFDTATIVMTTQTGKQATIQNSRRATYGYDQRIEVHGAKGMIQAENHRPVAIELATGAGFTRPPLHDFFMTRYVAAYAAELTAFIDTLVSGGSLTPSGEDGLAALRLAEAAEESVRSGKRTLLT
ncbi:MAG: inositol 2-dehydrogenase [Pseudomonadota bacterium]